MKKLLLTLAAGAALTMGLAGHVAPAMADPAGLSDCSPHTVPLGFFVNPGIVPAQDTCTVTNQI
jgi:hypothetical protein